MRSSNMESITCSLNSCHTSNKKQPIQGATVKATRFTHIWSFYRQQTLQIDLGFHMPTLTKIGLHISRT